MLLLLLLTSALGAPPNLMKAERHYQRGRLNRALRALGPQCTRSDKPATCEFLRAKIQVAMGHDFRARVAIHRMLQQNPNFAATGPDLSRKVEYLLTSIRRDLGLLTELELDRVESGAWGGVATLRLTAPVVHDLERITAHVQLPGHPSFTEIELTRAGDRFFAPVEVDLTGVDRLRYYLVTDLATGPSIGSGSATHPRLVTPTPGANNLANQPADEPAEEQVLALVSPNSGWEHGTETTVDDASDEPSSWPVWAIAAASAAVVVFGVVSAGIVAGDDGLH